MKKLMCENRKNCPERIARGIKEEDCQGDWKCEHFAPIESTPISEYLDALKGGTK